MKNNQTAPNFEIFSTRLAKEYDKVFRTGNYAVISAIMSPSDLARKMTVRLSSGMIKKDGPSIKKTCKSLGIKYTYEAIKKFLWSE